MSSFYTSDYQVIFCQNKGEKEFKSQFHDYNILIQRKMAFALLKITENKSKPHMIPLFEEAMIYLQKKENSVLKNTTRCLVLSSKPVGRDCLHVFGDNAFTCSFPPEIGSSSDRHQTSMRNAGIVVGLLDKVRHWKSGVSDEIPFLRGIFSFLVGTGSDKTKAHLKKVVDNERKYAIDNAPEALKAEIIDRHRTESDDGDLLSKSFLANQLKSKAITDENNRNIRVQFWIASATFSIIAIQIKGKNRTYGFLQTYPFNEKNKERRQVIENQSNRQVVVADSKERMDVVTPRGEKRGRDDEDGVQLLRPKSAKSGGSNAKSSDPLILEDVDIADIDMNRSSGNSTSNSVLSDKKTNSAFPNSTSGSLPLELELELELL